MSNPGETGAPQHLVWTPDLVRRFWTGVSQAGIPARAIFGLNAKRVIGWLIARHLTPGGRHLDFGAGDGHVAAHLIEQGFPFAVFEPSDERLSALEARVAALGSGFLGRVTPATCDPFDAVTCFEVLEHVLDQDFERVCDELAASVRRGGKLIVSVPNHEDLRDNTVYCPVSNLLFHRWQHVRTVAGGELVEWFERRGFRKIVLHELDFDEALFRPYLHFLGFAPRPRETPSRPGLLTRLAGTLSGRRESQEVVPLHIHHILNDIDGHMGGRTGLLYVAAKER